MPLFPRPSLALPLLLLALAACPTVDATETPSARSTAIEAAPPLSPRERGELARRFVRKWGDYVQQVYAVPVGVWARRMVPTFVAADALDLRRALQRDTLEGALSELNGTGHRLSDARVIDAIARAPRDIGGRTIEAKLLGDTLRDLTFRPIQPCRILDTRNAGGPIAANTSRDFVAVFNASASGDYSAQGGSSTNCGAALTGATAVAINLTAVFPSTAGYATVYPFNTPLPLAASINYGAGAIVNNTVVVRIPSPQGSHDFSVYSFARSDFVADIVGVFSPPQKTAVDCYGTSSDGSVLIQPLGLGQQTATVCPGTHVATMLHCNNTNTTPNLYLAGTSLTGNSGTCHWSSNSNATLSASVRIGARCCRVRGR